MRESKSLALPLGYTPKLNNTDSRTIGNKLVGEIAEIDDKFAVIKNAAVVDFHKNLETAVEAIIQTYNLNH